MVVDMVIFMEVVEVIIMVVTMAENIVAESIREDIQMEKEMGNLKNLVMMSKKIRHLFGEVVVLIQAVQVGKIVKILLILRKDRIVLKVIVMLIILKYFLSFVL